MRTTKLACVVMGPRAEAPGTRTKTRPVRGGRGQVAHQVSRPHGNGSHRAPGRATTRVSDHVFIPLNPEDAYADANHAPPDLNQWPAPLPLAATMCRERDTDPLGTAPDRTRRI
jgi:hypothetical protein